MAIAAPANGKELPVEVGRTGVAVGDPVRLTVGTVPLLMGAAEDGRALLVGRGRVTVERVLEGQYVVVNVCVVVVPSVVQVVVTVDVMVVLALAVDVG